MLLKLTVLYLVAFLVTQILRRQSAAQRHLVWTLALLASLALPLTQLLVPQQPIANDLYTAAAQSITVSAKRTQSEIPLPAPSEIWLLGTTLLLTQSLYRRHRLGKVRAASARLKQYGRISIRTTPTLQSPGVCGIRNPTILLPADSAKWTPATRRAVYSHELAHIRRLDTATFLLGEIAQAVFWFHPLAWLANIQMRREAERACDDAVLRHRLRPSFYAGQLLSLARAFPLQPAIPMATTSQLESRMKSILNPNVNRNAAARKTWLLAALATVAILVPLSTFTLQAADPQKPPPAHDSVGTQTLYQIHNYLMAFFHGAPAQESTGAKPVRVGGSVMQANLIHKVNPIYPADAKARRIQGVVTLKVLIDKSGTPTNLEPVNPDVDASLIAAAIEAVSQWRYKPTLLNGEPVEVTTTIDINFTLIQ